MSDSFQRKSANRIVRWLAIITVVLSSQSIFGFTPNSWADSSTTGGKSEGSAAGSSDTSARLETGTFSRSHAVSIGDHLAKAHTRTGSWETADIPTRKVTIDTGAEAEAASDQNGLVAKADAWADGTAGNVTNSNSTGAMATSDANQQTASSWASDGSFANAVSGPFRSADSYTVNGTTTHYDKKKMSISLSYQPDGHFSLAVAGKKKAGTFIGQTSDLQALSSHNINSLMHSSMFASSWADGNSVSAYARSELAMTFSDARSEAAARGMSEAYASVRRDGAQIIVTVRASDEGGCASTRKSRQSKQFECMVVRKVIHLDKAGHFKVVARAGSHRKHFRRH